MRVRGTFWLAWGLLGLVLEIVALTNGIENDTLTMTIARTVPGIIIFALLGAGVWHFWQAYRTRRGR